MKVKIILFILPLVIVVGFFIGPRISMDDRIQVPNLPDDLDAYLEDSEARFSDLRPNTEKTIIWANPEKTKTPLSLVYLHGYSASRQEIVPVCDEVAKALGANLFYTRLRGHQRSLEAFGEATVNDYLQDAVEALEIGRRIGEKTIVIANSTGATLATWLATREDTENIYGFVLISPNFWPKSPLAGIALWPWGKQLVSMFIGEYQSWEPSNEEEGKYWNTKYPSAALLVMMKTVEYVDELNLKKFQKPVLIIHSTQDQVVSSDKVIEKFGEIGSPMKRREVINDSENLSHHVLAGNILSPSTNEKVIQLILEFIRSINGN